MARRLEFYFTETTRDENSKKIKVIFYFSEIPSLSPQRSCFITYLLCAYEFE